jgi:hypothetical protein
MDDILGIVFLALVCIIVGSLVRSLLPEGSYLFVPSGVFLLVCLWIAYDYILNERHEARTKCPSLKRKHRNAMVDIQRLVNEINAANDEPETPPRKTPKEEHRNQPMVKEHDGEIDIDLYNMKTIPEMHKNMGCDADTALYNRMKYQSLQPRMSQDIRAQWNKFSLQPYLEEELQDHANREWWNSDFLEHHF